MRSGWNGGGRGERGGYGGGSRDRGGFDRGGGYDRGGYDQGGPVLSSGQRQGAGGNGNDERDFFDERTEVKTHSLTCPHCNQPADYALTWLVRRKRARLTGYGDSAREARFDKARSYMVRRDDQVACQNIRCRKRFEIAGLQSVAFLEDAARGSVEDRAARVRAAFAGRARE